MLARLVFVALAAAMLVPASFAAGPADLAFMRGSWEGRDGRKDAVVYVAQPGGKPKTEFRLTASGANAAPSRTPPTTTPS